MLGSSDQTINPGKDNENMSQNSTAAAHLFIRLLGPGEIVWREKEYASRRINTGKVGSIF